MSDRIRELREAHAIWCETVGCGCLWETEQARTAVRRLVAGRHTITDVVIIADMMNDFLALLESLEDGSGPHCTGRVESCVFLRTARVAPFRRRALKVEP